MSVCVHHHEATLKYCNSERFQRQFEDILDAKCTLNKHKMLQYCHIYPIPAKLHVCLHNFRFFFLIQVHIKGVFLGGRGGTRPTGAWNKKKKSLREVCRERSGPLHVGQFCVLQLNPDTDSTAAAASAAEFRRYLAVFHSFSVTQTLFLFLTMNVTFFPFF